MTLKNTMHRWGPVAQFLHWLIVALVITQVTLATLADDLPASMKKLTLMSRHKSIGITVLMLVVLRLLWRWRNPIPDLPPPVKPFERRLARAAHALFYVLLIAIPITGWLMSSARGFSVSWFGLFQLPDLVSKSKPLYLMLMDTHDTLAWTLVGLAGLHAAAALRHHFMLRDDVLRRMLPFTDSARNRRP